MLKVLQQEREGNKDKITFVIEDMTEAERCVINEALRMLNVVDVQRNKYGY